MTLFTSRNSPWHALCLIISLAILPLLPACSSPDNPSENHADDVQSGEDAVDGADTAELRDTEASDPLIEGEWNWVPIEGSKCGSGSTAGIGILPGADPTRLVIYFNGGGACWDTASCYFFNAAANIEVDYGESHFRSEVGAMGPNEFFGQASFTFIPYCTGDLHAGRAVGQYDALQPDRRVHHNGAANVDLYLQRLKAEYPQTQTIHVLGVSAGGYGAMFNYEKIRSTFPDATIHVLADSAPLVQPHEGRWSAWQTAWKPDLPADCDTCSTRMPDIASHLIQNYPDSRFGLLSWEDDATIMIYFAYPAGELGAAVRALASDAYDADNASAFLVEGTDHVMLAHPPTIQDASGKTLTQYLIEWAYP